MTPTFSTAWLLLASGLAPAPEVAASAPEAGPEPADEPEADGYFVYSNDTGPDDANHDFEGIIIQTTAGRFRAGVDGVGEQTDLHLTDVGPTVLKWFGIEPPADAIGKPMDWVVE